MSTPGHGPTGATGQGLHLAPFRGLRYVPERVGSLAAVTSPPYDVVVRPDGLRHLETADPHNIVRLILPQAATAADRHRQAARTLRRWQDENVLAADPVPALYVYEQRGEGILQRGLIGALRLTPREEGVVLPHEDVMPHIIEDRAALMRDTSANLEPLLFSYRGDGNGTEGAAGVIERVIRTEPLLSTTTDDGYAHRLWSITAQDDLDRIDRDLSHRHALIADGHHRWATYLRLRAEQPAPGPWDFGLVLLVDTARYPLRVRAIHRLLHRLPVADALAAVGGTFRVHTLDVPLQDALDALAQAVGGGGHGNAFLLAGDGRFHLVDRPDPELLARTIPADRPRAWRELDATVLHSTLLEHVWHVPDDPEHIGYIHETAAAVEQAERHGGTAVLMHPVHEDVVRELAEQGVTMPRKSTSFGPKPATGLVLRSLALD
ncbi:SpoOJ or ParA or ParB or repB family protein [Streptomyces sp. NRRL B-1568]|nr:SpoOJ or ParA or ParB or repB family protein [Streptomyces sp. NRRL B-1568]